MNILILLRNILVPAAILLWVLIGIVALLIFLKNKFSGRGFKADYNNAYKETYVQNHNSYSDKAVQDALKATNSISKSDSSKIPKGDKSLNNKSKSNLCL